MGWALMLWMDFLVVLAVLYHLTLSAADDDGDLELINHIEAMLDFLAFGFITIFGIRSYFSTNMPPFSYEGTAAEFDQEHFLRGQSLRNNYCLSRCCGALLDLDWTATAASAFMEHNDGYALLMARAVAANTYDERILGTLPAHTGDEEEHELRLSRCTFSGKAGGGVEC